KENGPATRRAVFVCGDLLTSTLCGFADPLPGQAQRRKLKMRIFLLSAACAVGIGFTGAAFATTAAPITDAAKATSLVQQTAMVCRRIKVCRELPAGRVCKVERVCKERW